MSYILNALKKSEQERAGDAGAQTNSAVPYAVHAPAPAPRLKPAPVLMAVGGGGAAVLLAVAVWAAGPWSGNTIEADSTASNPTPSASVGGAPTGIAHDAPANADIIVAAATTTSPPAVGFGAPGPATPMVLSEAGLDVPADQGVEPRRSGPRADILNRVAEPTAGSVLPTQRTPRPVSQQPDVAAPLVAIRLDPPRTHAIAKPSADAAARIPPPPVPSEGDATSLRAVDTGLQEPLETPQSRSKTVSVTPDDADRYTPRDVAALTPSRADRVSLSEAADFHEKGWSFERSGDFPRALEAFSRALELRPDFADAYLGRAWIRDRMDQLEQATADYGQAIRIEPEFAAAYGSRGVARFYLNELAQAERDFERTLRHGRGELRRFAILWRYLSAEHDGRNGATQLVADTQNINLDRWPGIIAQFYLGRVGAEAVLDEARGSDPVVTRERLCVAYFFIAQKYLLDGSAAQARDHFQKAVGTGVTEFIQYKAAQRELNRLARLR